MSASSIVSAFAVNEFLPRSIFPIVDAFDVYASFHGSNFLRLMNAVLITLIRLILLLLMKGMLKAWIHLLKFFLLYFPMIIHLDQFL